MEYFYNGDFRKSIVAFGALFNQIMLKKYDSDGNELKRINIPLGYASKEKYRALLQADPELKKAVAIQLPRMTFELVDFQYDMIRNQQQMLKNSAALSTNSRVLTTKYVAAPWNLTFSLHIMARDIDDGLQIIEQVVNRFRPDYTISINFEPRLGSLGIKDTPIIMTGTQVEDTTVGPVDEVRIIVWTLTFVMKTFLFGPTDQQGQILSVFVNYYDNTVESRVVRVSGIPVTANSVKGSNVLVMSANVQSVLTANDVLKFNDTVIRINSLNNTTVNGNVYMLSTNKLVTVERMITANQRVSAYIANVTPNTALSTDNYTITELFQDFNE